MHVRMEWVFAHDDVTFMKYLIKINKILRVNLTPLKIFLISRDHTGIEFEMFGVNLQ